MFYIPGRLTAAHHPLRLGRARQSRSQTRVVASRAAQRTWFQDENGFGFHKTCGRLAGRQPVAAAAAVSAAGRRSASLHRTRGRARTGRERRGLPARRSRRAAVGRLARGPVPLRRLPGNGVPAGPGPCRQHQRPGHSRAVRSRRWRVVGVHQHRRPQSSRPTDGQFHAVSPRLEESALAERREHLRCRRGRRGTSLGGDTKRPQPARRGRPHFRAPFPRERQREQPRAELGLCAAPWSVAAAVDRHGRGRHRPVGRRGRQVRAFPTRAAGGWPPRARRRLCNPRGGRWPSVGRHARRTGRTRPRASHGEESRPRQ